MRSPARSLFFTGKLRTMNNHTELRDVIINGTSFEDLIAAYNQFASQDFVKEMIEKSTNPQHQKSVIVDTILFQQERQHLKDNERLSFTRGEVYLHLGISKEFLKP